MDTEKIDERTEQAITVELARAALPHKLQLLHETRERYLEAAQHDQQLQEEFDTRHADEIALLAELNEETAQMKQTLCELEKTIRTEGVMIYTADPSDKVICLGVNIRVMTEYDYEPEIALRWAKERGICLSLDGKSFKDLCKSDFNRPDFVQVIERPTATIAQDLSEIVAKV